MANQYVQKTIGRFGYEHILKAESVLGKRLPHKSVVHHVDGIKNNNENSNLVICQSQKYHYFLHLRKNALEACGNKHWRTCVYCKKFDDTKRMVWRSNGNWCHSECEKGYYKIKGEKEKQQLLKRRSQDAGLQRLVCVGQR